MSTKTVRARNSAVCGIGGTTSSQTAAMAARPSSVKATLVIIFFMHVKGASEKLTGAIVVSGFFFLAILIALSLADYMTRSWR